MILNKKITIYTNTPQPDSSGGFVDFWSPGRTAWADIQITSSGKLFTGSQEYNGTYYTIIARTISLNIILPIENYKIEIRAWHKNRILKILSSEQQDLKSEFTILQCIESNG